MGVSALGTLTEKTPTSSDDPGSLAKQPVVMAEFWEGRWIPIS